MTHVRSGYGLFLQSLLYHARVAIINFNPVIKTGSNHTHSIYERLCMHVALWFDCSHVTGIPPERSAHLAIGTSSTQLAFVLGLDGLWCPSWLPNSICSTSFRSRQLSTACQSWCTSYRSRKRYRYIYISMNGDWSRHVYNHVPDHDAKAAHFKQF